MAEVAAGAYIAAEAIEHGAEAGYAAYLVSKPTLPLKATFSRIATATDDHTRRSLARSNHTLTVLSNKAYIFGGRTASDELASTDVHVVTVEHSGKPEMDYSLLPALPTLENGEVPAPRSDHAACAFHGNVAVYGGADASDLLIEEDCAVWLFSPERRSWDRLDPASESSTPGSRRSAKLFQHENHLILFGGTDSSSSAASDLWQFDVAARSWSQLPTAPIATSNATLAAGRIYLIHGVNALSSEMYSLDITEPRKKMIWSSLTFPTNPLAPGPRSRHDGALLPITTGYGRNYLIYLLGARSAKPSPPTSSEPTEETHSLTSDHQTVDAPAQWSDTWVLQLPSSPLSLRHSLSLKDGIKPAKIKDAIRSAVGAETGHLSWSEAVVQVPGEKEVNAMVEEGGEGKLHPGPRALFGADVAVEKAQVVFWGGVDARGERVGDGWVVRFE